MQLTPRKLFFGSLGLFVVYGGVLGAYFFLGEHPVVPHTLQGTSADPATFMNPEELGTSQQYSLLRYWMYFISYPMEWMVYLGILVFGMSLYFERWTEKISRFLWVRITVFTVLLLVVLFFLTFPLDWLRYQMSLHYGVSVEPFQSWMKDRLTSFWLNAAMTTLMLYVLVRLIRKFPGRWWFYAWLLSLPFTAFLYYIQPVLIDPLYNEYTILEDSALEQDILELAARADVPADRIYQVDKSAETNALNAYVNGIGNNLRIVLWDTTLTRLDDSEILFIMAHEIGHYVLHHLYWSLIGAFGMSFIGMYLTYRCYNFFLRKWKAFGRMMRPGELAALPVLLLILSMLTFVSMPLQNGISRQAERAADRYAMELTQDPDAAIGSFQQLALASRNMVNPPWLVKVYLYGHPPLAERIEFAETYRTTLSD